MSAGCADLSSLIYWSDAEVNPIGLLVTYSGSTGNRLLFWHSSRQAAVTEVAVTTPVSTAAPATLATASTISVSEPQAAAPSLGAPSVSNAHLAGPSNAVGASSTYAGITTIMTNSSSGSHPAIGVRNLSGGIVGTAASTCQESALMRLGMASSSSLLSDAPEKGPDFSSLVPSANPYALSLILNKPTSSILANLNPTSGGALFGSGGGITAITGLVPGNPSIPSVCPTPYPSSHQSHSTSTPAAILTTYSSQQHGPTDSASVVPPAGMLIGFPGESHASVHLLNHQHHHTHNPQPHPVGVETKVASPFGQTGRSDRERDWERERERDRDQHRNRDRVRPPIRHTLRPEESLPASALLSLLHSCSNQVQKKIFLKLDDTVFTGALFSLTPEDIEIAGLSSSQANDLEVASAPTATTSSTIWMNSFGTPSSAQVESGALGSATPSCQDPGVITLDPSGLPPPRQPPRMRSDQVISSFTIVFVMQAAAPPCVVAHYAELARLIGVQVRRAEVYWHYLSRERDMMMQIFEFQTDAFQFTSGLGFHLAPGARPHMFRTRTAHSLPVGSDNPAEGGWGVESAKGEPIKTAARHSCWQTRGERDIASRSGKYEANDEQGSEEEAEEEELEEEDEEETEENQEEENLSEEEIKSSSIPQTGSSVRSRAPTITGSMEAGSSSGRPVAASESISKSGVISAIASAPRSPSTEQSEIIEAETEPFAMAMQIQGLCSDLAGILRSVVTEGRVNAKIHQLYHVFFCLPHKVYCPNLSISHLQTSSAWLIRSLEHGTSEVSKSQSANIEDKNRFLSSLGTLHSKSSSLFSRAISLGNVSMSGSGAFGTEASAGHLLDIVSQAHIMPGIRPLAVWRAMDCIRPYHALLLITKKEELLLKHLPPDVNPTMIEFIQCLTPLTNLHSLSLMLHSQEHCLRLSMWLIYRGHAIIIYPIAGNNTYILSPFFGHWFQPYMVLQFATAYPCINLAEILASFSNGVTLKDTGPENRTSTYQLCSDTDYSDQANYRWSNLPSSTKVGIITWLLRRRLIIQLHTYIVSALDSVLSCLPQKPKLKLSRRRSFTQSSCNLAPKNFPSVESDLRSGDQMRISPKYSNSIIDIEGVSSTTRHNYTDEEYDYDDDDDDEYAGEGEEDEDNVGDRYKKNFFESVFRCVENSYKQLKRSNGTALPPNDRVSALSRDQSAELSSSSNRQGIVSFFIPPHRKQHLLNSSGLKNFGPPKEVSLHCSLAQQVLADQIVRSKSCYSERRHPIRRGRKLKGSKPVCIMTNGDSEEDRIRLIQLVAGPHLPDSLVVNLARALPSRDHLVGFLSYPGLLEDIRLLMVFLRLLPRLPAHFEELLFTEADLSRQTLTACLQRYSAFLLTFHTPDPVTACFTGINWPD